MKSDQDSTSSAGDYFPYWSDYTQEISSESVVAYRDRLCALWNGTHRSLALAEAAETLVVLNQRDLSPEEELTTDLLAILTVFGARVSWTAEIP